MDILFDIFGIVETKIDGFFFDGKLKVDNNKLHRQDHNDRSGGIMRYNNDNAPHRLLKQFTRIHHGTHFLMFEIIIKFCGINLVYIGHQM